jgi:hypothetical protein
MRYRWQGRDLCPVDQVGNAKDSTVNLSPASDAPAQAVKAAWAPLLSGQAIPLIGEEVGYVEPCDDE